MLAQVAAAGVDLSPETLGGLYSRIAVAELRTVHTVSEQVSQAEGQDCLLLCPPLPDVRALKRACLLLSLSLLSLPCISSSVCLSRYPHRAALAAAGTAG